MSTFTKQHARLSFLISLFLWVFPVVLFGAGGVARINGNFQSLTLSGSDVVALDFDSSIFTSVDDGQTFVSRFDIEDAFTALDQLESIEALGSTVVSVGVDAIVARSGDGGITWSAATSVTLAGSLNAAAGRAPLGGESSQVWLAVGDDGFDGVVYQSVDDGLNWTVLNTGAAFSGILLQDVIWTGSRWIACGRDQFSNEGAVFNSLDGATWTSSTIPLGSAPLLQLERDNGSETVVTVGEEGVILRSVDDGLNFSAIAEGLLSEDLPAIGVDSAGTFFIGGAGSVLIELVGTSPTFLVQSSVLSGPILDIIIIGNEPSVAGAFGGFTVRTIPFTAVITAEGSADFRITVSQTLTNRSYFLESTNDLLSGFEPVEGTTRFGTGGAIFYDVSLDGPALFFRVVEF